MNTLEEKVKEELKRFQFYSGFGESALNTATTHIMQIAQEFTTEMCKKQREICANPPNEEQEGKDEDTFIAYTYIITAPLATEVE